MVKTTVHIAEGFKDKVLMFKEKTAPPFAKFVLRTSSWSAAVLVDAVSVGPSEGAVIQIQGLKQKCDNFFIYSVGDNYYAEHQSVFLANRALNINPCQVHESKRLNSGFCLKFGNFYVTFERGLAPIIAPPSPIKRRPRALDASGEPPTHAKRRRKSSNEPAANPPIGIQPPVQPIGLPASLQRRVEITEQMFRSRAIENGVPLLPRNTRTGSGSAPDPPNTLAANDITDSSVVCSDVSSADHSTTNSGSGVSSSLSTTQESVANLAHESQAHTEAAHSAQTSTPFVPPSEIRNDSQSSHAQATADASGANLGIERPQADISAPQRADSSGAKSSIESGVGSKPTSVNDTDSPPTAGQHIVRKLIRQEKEQRQREQQEREQREREQQEREQQEREQQEREQRERHERELENERNIRELAQREVLENSRRKQQQWEHIRQLRLQQQNHVPRSLVEPGIPYNHQTVINEPQHQGAPRATEMPDPANAGTERVAPRHAEGIPAGPASFGEEWRSAFLASVVSSLRESLSTEVRQCVAGLQQSLITDVKDSLTPELTQAITEAQKPLVVSMNNELSSMQRCVAQVHGEMQELRKHLDTSVESLTKRVSRAVNLITAVNETSAQQLSSNVESAITQMAANVNQQLDSSMRQMNNSFASGMRQMQIMLSNGPDLDLDPSESQAHSEQE